NRLNGSRGIPGSSAQSIGERNSFAEVSQIDNRRMLCQVTVEPLAAAHLKRKVRLVSVSSRSAYFPVRCNSRRPHACGTFQPWVPIHVAADWKDDDWKVRAPAELYLRDAPLPH